MTYSIQFKTEVVKFFHKHGIAKTIQNYNLSKSSIYYWSEHYLLGKELNEEERYISRNLDARIITFIVRVKKLFPKMGRGKMKVLCDKYSYINNTKEISLSSIGRVLAKIKSGEL
jgi:hypothetical protein